MHIYWDITRPAGCGLLQQQQQQQQQLQPRLHMRTHVALLRPVHTHHLHHCRHQQPQQPAAKAAAAAVGSEGTITDSTLVFACRCFIAHAHQTNRSILTKPIPAQKPKTNKMREDKHNKGKQRTLKTQQKIHYRSTKRLIGARHSIHTYSAPTNGSFEERQGRKRKKKKSVCVCLSV